jgi:hypothetical protein
MRLLQLSARLSGATQGERDVLADGSSHSILYSGFPHVDGDCLATLLRPHNGMPRWLSACRPPSCGRAMCGLDRLITDTTQTTGYQFIIFFRCARTLNLVVVRRGGSAWAV